MEENNTKKTSLHDVLEEATEIKAPSETKSKMWSFDEEEAEEVKEEEKESTGKSKAEGSKDKEANQKASAETLTASIDILTDLGGGLIINNRFRNRFTDEQFEKAQELQDKPKEELAGEDLTLRNRFDRENSKRQKKLKELPFEGDEIERLNRIFFNYFKVSGKELSPDVLLYMGISAAILEKLRVIYSD